MGKCWKMTLSTEGLSTTYRQLPFPASVAEALGSPLRRRTRACRCRALSREGARALVPGLALCARGTSFRLPDFAATCPQHLAGQISGRFCRANLREAGVKKHGFPTETRSPLQAEALPRRGWGAVN